MSAENDAAIRHTAHAQEAPPVRQDADAWRALAFLLAYFVAYVLVRSLMPGALDRDEAEIIHLTQELQLGNGTQPPLYAWLQWLAFHGFGVERFSLVLPKALALVATYVLMYQLARPLVGRDAALAAAASLALFPQIGWEALRIQTHSVLLTTLACATLGCYVALLKKPDLPRYALLGIVCGLGMQSKYNFGVFLLGVGCASLLVREHRQVVWNRKLWITALLGLLVFLPHGVWMLNNMDAAFTGTVRKMQAGNEGMAYLARVGTGLLQVPATLFSFLALPACIYAALCWPLRGQIVFDRTSPASRFFLASYATFGVLLLVLVLTGEVGVIKERWMIPLLFTLPLAVFVMFPALRTPGVCRRIRYAAYIAALLFLALLPARLWLAPAFGKVVSPHQPYAQLAEAIGRHCPAAQTVVTESVVSAGNLRFARPELRTVLLDDAVREHPRLAGPVVLVTHRDRDSDAIWRPMFLAAYPDARSLRQEQVRLARRFGSPGVMGFEVGCYMMK